MEYRRRIASNDIPSKPFVNQSTNASVIAFSYADGVSDVQNKTSSRRNLFSYADGTTAGTSNNANAREWLSLKAGDVLTMILYDITVISPGLDYIELYLKSGSYYTELGSHTFNSDSKYLVFTKTLTNDGVISGIHHLLNGYTHIKYRWKIYVNGIRVA